MTSLTTFDSTKEALLDLLNSIKEGKIQLPDFQREWVWDDEHVRSLLASVSLSYPIGAVMLLQTGNAEVRFRPRPIEGVQLIQPVLPDRLILDGQQRLTSLFQALISGKPVTTRDIRGNPIRRWYYLDIAKALDPSVDREDAIFGVPEDRIVRNFRNEIIADYSSSEKECTADVFPLPLVFDIARLTDWQMRYLQADPAHISERLLRWNHLVQEVVQRFQGYQVPVIVLRKETPKVAVCQVFEKVNTGGVSLNVFQLLTATYAADDYNLRDDWAAREKRLKKHRVLRKLENTDFLQAVTLLATYSRHRQALRDGVAPDRAPAISCKRKDVLNLGLEDYQNWAEAATRGFEKAAWLLQSQSIFTAEDLPYQTQVTPLAAILAVLGSQADNDGVRQKLLRWYWCGVFGELYGGSTESRLAKDLPEVLGWIGGGPEPDTIGDAHFAPDRLLSLRTRNSAAYKGIYALLLRDGCKDFRTGYAIDLHTYFEDRVDIHHIFPQAWCRKNGIAAGECDSIINKTAQAARTNRMMGGDAPSQYLARMERQAGISPDRMDKILQSHLIDPGTLRADQFWSFFEARRRALLDLIAAAMGKPLAPIAAEPEPPAPQDYEENDDIEEVA
jgi:hypothetical protein